MIHFNKANFSIKFYFEFFLRKKLRMKECKNSVKVLYKFSFFYLKLKLKNFVIFF